MKTFLLLVLVSLSFDRRDCFLTYPLSGQLLEEIFNSIDIDNNYIRNDLLKHSIDGEKCLRVCSENDRKICHFKFTLKSNQILGGSCGNCSKGNVTDCFTDHCIIADGRVRGYLALNFKLPGPKIEVCKDDIIVVDLFNEAEGTSTSLHWHGLRQFGTPFMDGVPYLTQCPVNFGESFRYSFFASDEGTHFYHSHAGQQKANGVYGPLIVRGIEKNNPNRNSYDFDLSDHTIIVSDWMHVNAEDSVPGISSRSSLSRSILINGRGRYINETTNSFSFAPLTLFHVEAGKKYRFRLINAGVNVCPFVVQIEGHNFTIIATEVSYIQPIEVGSLLIMSGERYDFVVDTNNHPIQDYFIRFKQITPCKQKLQGFAVLRYHQKKSIKGRHFNDEFVDRPTLNFDDQYSNGFLLNSLEPRIRDVPITHLKDFRVDEEITKGEADQTEYLFFDTPTIANNLVYKDEIMRRFMFITGDAGGSFIATVNNISFLYPSFPLLLERKKVNEEMFCDSETIKSKKCHLFDGVPICRCVHRLKFKLGSIAELIAVNVKDKISHPMHLHGHKFHVMDMGLLRANMTESEVKNGAIPRVNHRRPTYKDTVLLPYPGFVRLRFRANNPGYWLFHCHFDWHLPIGMAVLIQVGEPEDMREPPENFPRCNNYMPNGIV